MASPVDEVAPENLIMGSLYGVKRRIPKPYLDYEYVGVFVELSKEDPPAALFRDRNTDVRSAYIAF
jgi:hypothetical protein